jgi:metallophosphoesterase superfamily enzyme
MTNWYTADTHFGHENVIKFCKRPFRSANHMDAVLMQNLWAMVGPKDALWIIGDFAHGPKAKDTDWLRMLFDKLPGAEKHLVVGNHDLEPTQALPWTTVNHLAEVRDGPQNQAHTGGHADAAKALAQAASDHDDIGKPLINALPSRKNPERQQKPEVPPPSSGPDGPS